MIKIEVKQKDYTVTYQDVKKYKIKKKYIYIKTSCYNVYNELVTVEDYIDRSEIKSIIIKKVERNEKQKL